MKNKLFLIICSVLSIFAVTSCNKFIDLGLSPEKLTINAEGKEITITSKVSSFTNCEIVIHNEDGADDIDSCQPLQGEEQLSFKWIDLTCRKDASGNMSLSVKIAPNETGKTRTATIMVGYYDSADRVTITQLP